MRVSNTTMEWRFFDRLPERTVKRARLVVRGVIGDDDKFYADRMVGDEGMRSVLEFLSKQTNRQGAPLKDATKQGYLSAVSRLLSVADMDNQCYRDKVMEYEHTKLERMVSDSESAKAREVLLRLLNKSNTDIAVIAALIYYGCSTKIQIQHLAVTRCDENNGNDCYMDLDNCMFYVNREGYMPCSYDVPQGFVDYVRSLNVRTWILGSKRSSPQSISNAFKRCAGCSYRDLRTMYYATDETDESINDIVVVSEPVPTRPRSRRRLVTRQPPEVIELAESEQTGPKLTIKIGRSVPVQRSVEVIELCELDQTTTGPTKIIIKPRYKCGVSWDSMDDPTVAASTNSGRRHVVLSMQKALFSVSDKFYYTAFETEGSVERVKSYLSGRQLAMNTQKYYLDSLSKMLSQTDCGVAKYAPYYLLCKAAQMSLDTEQQTLADIELSPKPNKVNFMDVVDIARRTYTNVSVPIEVRVYALMIIHSMDWKADTVIGILRLSDLMDVKLANSNEGGSYLDPDRRELCILADVTKNKCGRTIKLSDLFMADLRSVIGATATWFIPPTNIKVMANSINEQFGHMPMDIRSGYAFYLNSENVPMTIFRKICMNMGHKHQTSLVDYIGYGRFAQSSSTAEVDA